MCMCVCVCVCVWACVCMCVCVCVCVEMRHTSARQCLGSSCEALWPSASHTVELAVGGINKHTEDTIQYMYM